MLKAILLAEDLKGLLKAMISLGDEATFSVKTDGMYSRLSDPAKVAMCIVSLKKQGFESYEADKCEFSVDIDKVVNSLKVAETGDKAEVVLEENRLRVAFGNITRKVGLLSSEIWAPSIPQLNFKAKVGLSVKNLTHGLKACAQLTDHVTLIANSDIFKIRGIGDVDDVELKLPKGLLDSLECQEDCSAHYSLDYFQVIAKAITSDKVVLEFGTNYPVNIRYEILNGHGTIEFIIAPRIEEE